MGWTEGDTGCGKLQHTTRTGHFYYQIWNSSGENWNWTFTPPSNRSDVMLVINIPELDRYSDGHWRDELIMPDGKISVFFYWSALFQFANCMRFLYNAFDRFCDGHKTLHCVTHDMTYKIIFKSNTRRNLQIYQNVFSQRGSSFAQHFVKGTQRYNKNLVWSVRQRAARRT